METPSMSSVCSHFKKRITGHSSKLGKFKGDTRAFNLVTSVTKHQLHLKCFLVAACVVVLLF